MRQESYEQKRAQKPALASRPSPCASLNRVETRTQIVCDGSLATKGRLPGLLKPLFR